MYLLLGRLRRKRVIIKRAVFFLFCAAAVLVVSGCASERGVEREHTDSTTPIILVHGFGGWGRDDVKGFYYWGGFTDLEGELRNARFNVHTAAVGPFSSNWDRACELYAFIKGGRVDYGESHSAEFGHHRYGPDYPGVYPDWDENHPVHLIGHSMGGQTARILAHLLRNGNQTERQISGAGCHELFRGDGQRIRSITTLSTPHNGTTLVNDIGIIDTIIKAAIVALSTTVESGLFPDFDLKMDQWGITREPKEPLSRYFTRLRKHAIWTRTERDFSLWDASVEGAAALNSTVSAEPDIFYFSFANEETAPEPFRGFQIPELSMIAVLMPGGVFMGSYGTNESWWVNDGVVNTVSMKGPYLESADIIVEFDGSPEPGEWNYMGVLSSIDHGDVIGIPAGDLNPPAGFESLTAFYRYICILLTKLPAG